MTAPHPPAGTPALRRARPALRGPLTALVAAAAVTGTIAATLGATGAQAADPTTAVGTDVGSRERAFAAASAEFGVPQSVLEAVSYAQTRWDFHQGHSTSGGYGPMHLVDVDLADRAGGRGLDVAAEPAPTPDADTLSRAAELTGLSEQALRTDELANIRGGAALLAAEQRALQAPTGQGTDPGAWYAAVAEASGSVQQEAATTFADDAFAAITHGASRHTVDGKDVSLAPTKATPQRGQLARLGLHTKQNGPVDCPAKLDCEWIPAPYEKLGPGAGDYGNHDLASRPTAPRITKIVIHNTEASYDTTLKLVTDPTYVSWQYTLRSSDGHIAQHVDPKDVAWHAGNWYLNTHSIGLEHEGFAATGADWFSEPMYRTSARLVTYLAKEYDIPLDRQHIVGHDQVPGVTPAYVAGMHWDPGPYWDWEHYFQLLGAPLNAHRASPRSELVRIVPGFEDNVQPVTSCLRAGVACEPQGTNFVYLHTAPDASSPLVNDIGRRADGSPSTTSVSDIGARAQAGLEFAVADRQGDWTAIWFNGVRGWFENPRKHPTAIPVRGSYVVPKAGLATVPVYGRAYPEASAYPAGIPVQSVVPLQYTFAAGQRYAVGDLTVPTDYYRATTFSLDTPDDHMVVSGEDRYYQISLGHRFAYVLAADVDVVKVT